MIQLRNCVVALLVLTMLIACSGSEIKGLNGTPGLQTPAPASGSTWPTTLPSDFIQPWEELDANGKVTAGINADSEFMAGVERTMESAAGTSDYGEAVRLESGDSGSGTLSWVMYRILMGDVQPGVVSVDANLAAMSDGSLSEYHVGLANYGENRWDWYGPFTDSHVRISTGAAVSASGDYLTDLGNHFVCIAAFDGAVLDVVGVGTNPYASADTEAPPVPAGLYAVPTTGGLDLNWDDVIAGDLAGYRVYYGDADFSDIDEAGVQHVDYLLGQPSHLLTGLSAKAYVRVSAVDVSGNESALCDAVSGTPLPGSGPDLRLATSAVSGLVNDSVTLTATGAVNYSWDLDGDGVYEITGDTTGTQPADTGRTGILRPNVRGTTEDGSCVSLAAVSLLVAGNSRPVANAYATPTTGTAPLNVTLVGGGVDDDGTIASWSWDFDGDGVFDQTDATDPGPFARSYDTAGLYNTKFRVEDDQGSWDVDTIAILVNPPGSGPNTAPTALLAIGTGEESGDTPHTVHFDASGSSDPDAGDSIVEYHWDLDGDGMYDGTTDTANYDYTYTTPGIFNVQVKVEDSHGATDTDTAEITVNVVGNVRPVADLQCPVSIGDAPFEFDFDATGSSDSDGSIVRYDWDFDGDGMYEITDGSDYISEFLFRDAGEFTVSVRVTDDQGAQATAYVNILARGWYNMLVSAFTDPDDSIRIIDLGQRPCIACDFDEDGHPMYILASSTDGRRWNDPMFAATNGGYGEIDMILVDGRPAIAYGREDTVDNALTYVRASDAAGTTWGTPVNVSSTEYTASGASMGIVNGNPAIVTIKDNNWPDYELHFYRASNTTGSSWGTDVTVLTDTISHPKLLVTDGLPTIFYRGEDPDAIHYVRATDANGTAWDAPVLIAAPGSGEYISWSFAVGIIDGNPAIVYGLELDSAPYTDRVYFRRATNAAGTTWGSATQVTDQHEYSDFGSLTTIDGNPAFCFEDYNIMNVVYCRATDTSGTSWATPELVCPGYWYVDDANYLAEVDGRAVVAYNRSITIDDSDYGQLYYAIKYE